MTLPQLRLLLSAHGRAEAGRTLAYHDGAMAAIAACLGREGKHSAEKWRKKLIQHMTPPDEQNA